MLAQGKIDHASILAIDENQINSRKPKFGQILELYDFITSNVALVVLVTSINQNVLRFATSKFSQSSQLQYSKENPEFVPAASFLSV